MNSLFEQIGGEPPLREIINDFVDRVFDDMMIGFFFRNADRARIKEMEYQFTAKFLGADIAYEGQPIRAAHRKHPIMGGQFDRRSTILRNTLRDHGVPDPVQAIWMQHVESLRPQVTKDAPGECDDAERKS